MLDPKFPIQIIHDKKNPYYIKEVLFSDDKYIFAKVDLEEKEYSYLNERTEEMIVISQDYDSWDHKYYVMSTYFKDYEAINVMDSKFFHEDNFEKVLKNEKFNVTEKLGLLGKIIDNLGYDLDFYINGNNSDSIIVARKYDGILYTSNNTDFKSFIKETDLIISNFHNYICNIMEIIKRHHVSYRDEIFISSNGVSNEDFKIIFSFKDLTHHNNAIYYGEEFEFSLKTEVQDLLEYMKSSNKFNNRTPNKEIKKELKDLLVNLQHQIGYMVG